jgi:eukaryotic-like serine/threonine-protein kinase
MANSQAFIDLPVSHTLRFAPVIGRTISHYFVVEKLGSGGMGAVYKAEDTDLDSSHGLPNYPKESGRCKCLIRRYRMSG